MGSLRTRLGSKGACAMLNGSISVSFAFILLRFILTPIRMQVLTRLLDPADYGIITLLSMSATAAAMLLSGGGFEVLMRRLPQADGDQRIRIFRSVFFVSSALGILAFVGMLMLPSMWSRFASISLSTKFAAALLCLLFLHIHQRIYYLLGCRQHIRARVTQLLWSDCWFVAILAFGFMVTWTAESAVWVWCGWLILVTVVTWRWVPLGRIMKISGEGMPAREVLAMGLPMLPLVMAEWTFKLVGQYILLAQSGAATMALYALAFNIAGIGYVVGVPLVDSLTTQFNGVYGAGSHREGSAASIELRRIVSQALRIIITVAVPVGLLFVFLAPPIVQLLAGPAFARAANFLPWTSLIPLLLLLNLLLARILLASGRSMAVGFGSLGGAGIALIACLLTVGRYGIPGILSSVSAGLLVTTVFMAIRARLFSWVDMKELRPGRLLAGGLLLAIAFASLGMLEGYSIMRLGAAGIVGGAVVVGFRWLTLDDFASDMSMAKDGENSA